MRLTSFRSLKERLLKDPEFRAEYEKLGPEFELIHAIIKKRTEKGFTQEALAKKIGKKQSAIARLESGFSNPTFSLLNQVAHALDSEVKISFSDRRSPSRAATVHSAR